MFHTTLRVDGMYCGHCVMELQGALEDIGAKNIRIDYLSGQTAFDTKDKPSVNSVANAVRRYNFQPNMVDIIEQTSIRQVVPHNV